MLKPGRVLRFFGKDISFIAIWMAFRTFLDRLDRINLLRFESQLKELFVQPHLLTDSKHIYEAFIMFQTRQQNLDFLNFEMTQNAFTFLKHIYEAFITYQTRQKNLNFLDFEMTQNAFSPLPPFLIALLTLNYV